MCDSENITNLLTSSQQLLLLQGGINSPHESVASSATVCLEDVAAENFWLREKLKEITCERDRLIREVANLQLELDMGELKRLPEDRNPNDSSMELINWIPYTETNKTYLNISSDLTIENDQFKDRMLVWDQLFP